MNRKIGTMNNQLYNELYNDISGHEMTKVALEDCVREINRRHHDSRSGLKTANSARSLKCVTLFDCGGQNKDTLDQNI